MIIQIMRVKLYTRMEADTMASGRMKRLMVKVNTFLLIRLTILVSSEIIRDGVKENKLIQMGQSIQENTKMELNRVKDYSFSLTNLNMKENLMWINLKVSENSNGPMKENIKVIGKMV